MPTGNKGMINQLSNTETLLSHQWTCHQWCVSLSSSLEVFGVRTVRWVIHNDDLEPIDVEIERSLLLIRDIPMCLLCPQDLAQQTGHHILLLLLAMALFETHLPTPNDNF